MDDPKSPDEFPDELLSAYLDDALSSEERVQIEQHLLAHPEAQQQVEKLRVVSSLLRRLPLQPARADLRDEVMKRIEKQQGSTEHIAKPKLTMGRSPRGWIWAGLAVAASIALMIYQERLNLDQPNSNLAHRSVQWPKSPNRDLEWTNPQAGDNSENETFDKIAAASSSASQAPAMDADASEQKFSATPSQFADSSSTPTLVVQVVMPARSRQNGTFENLLESEGLIDREDLEDFRELKTKQRFFIDHGAQHGFGAIADDVDKTEDIENQKRDLGRIADESANFSVEFAEIPVDLRAGGQSLVDGGESVEVIMVEAPEANVLSCLKKIQSDERNFVAIEVDMLNGQLNSRRAVDRRDKTVDSQLVEDSSWTGRQQFNRGHISPAQRALHPVKELVRSLSLAKAGKNQPQGTSKLPVAEPSVAKAQRKAIARSRLVGDNLIQVVFVLGTTAPPEPVSTQSDLQEKVHSEAVQPQ